MTIQTVYTEKLDQARVGMLATTENMTLVSRTVEGAAVGFGVPLVQGTADAGARATTTGDTAIAGISVLARSTTDDTYSVGESMRVITKGAIWVTASVDVAAGDDVTVVVASAEFSNTGGVSMNAKYETSASAGELALVRLA